MLLKRYLALAAGVLLFIVIYLSYFAFAHHQMEARFQEERVKFGVDGVVLTASTPATATTPGSAPATAPASTTTTDSTPTATPTATPSPVPTESPLIGPLPPASSSSPDDTPSPTPATTPDPASAPAAPPSSTMDERRHSPFLVLAAYHPGEDIRLAAAEPSPTTMPSPTVTATPTMAALSPAPATTGATNAATPSVPSTNGAPFGSVTESGAARPVPVEASVIVLLYHQFVPAGVKVSPRLQWTMNQDVFESEMKYLHDNGYHVVSVADVIRFLKHEIGLPPNSVAITIDDGYKSAIVYAAPILKKYGYPWTYFIYPDFITVNEGSGAASWNDLLELQKEGVDIECHSMTHPQLTRRHQLIKKVWHNFSDAEYDAWLTNETLGAKKLLEEKMGKPINCFAYPYGDYNKQVEAKVIAAGFEAIFTVADNPVHSTTDLHSIGRYTITRPVEKNFAAYLRQGALGVAEADPPPGGTTNNPRPIITAVLGYTGSLDPKSIETSVVDFGEVRHDFDPKTSTVRLYLPRDLIQSVVKVNLRVRDAETGQIMVANWHFNYEPGPLTNPTPHAPMVPATNSASMTNAPSASPKATVPTTTPPLTNSPGAASARESGLTPAMSAPSLSPH